jgi:hypothetical protein
MPTTNPDRFWDAPHHFYATSSGSWKTSEDLRDVMYQMEKEGLFYTLWFIPVADDSPYDIRIYAPQVPGAFIIGQYTPKKRK